MDKIGKYLIGLCDWCESHKAWGWFIIIVIAACTYFSYASYDYATSFTTKLNASEKKLADVYDNIDYRVALSNTKLDSISFRVDNLEFKMNSLEKQVNEKLDLVIRLVGRK